MNDKNSTVNENELYISVDIEAAGPVPAVYSMLSIGACVVGSPEVSFYIELKPINDRFIPEALAVCGFSLEQLQISGIEPSEGMKSFNKWIEGAANGLMPVFIGFNAPFDWMFVHEYFHRYLGHNPFGHKALDIKAFYMGLTGVSWSETGMNRVSQRFLGERELTHHALQDALDQAEIFRSMLAVAKNRAK